MANTKGTKKSRDKKIEKAFATKEKKEGYYRALLESTSSYVAVVNDKGIVKFESQSMANILGYEPGDRIGKSGFELLHPDDLANAAEALTQLLQTPRNTLSREMRVQHSDGSWHIFQVTGKNLFDDPVVGGIVVSFSDITELRKSQAAQYEAEKLYSSLVEQTTDGIDIIQDEVIKFANQALADITGYSREELIGMYFLDMVLPNYQNLTTERYQTRIEGSSPPPYIEIQIKRKDGDIRHIEATGALVKYNGKPASMGIIRDVSRRKHAEEQMRMSEQRYRLLAENASDVIISVNLDLTPNYISPSIERLLGFSAEESMTRTIEEAITPRSLDIAMNAFNEGLRSYQKKRKNTSPPQNRLELEYYHKNGSIVWIEVTASFVLDQKGNPSNLVCVLRDISKRKKLEDTLNQYRDQLEDLVKERTQELELRIKKQKQAEKALRDGEERFRDLSDLLPQIVFETDDTGILKFFNRVGFDKTGYTSDEIYSSFDISKLLIADDIERSRYQLQRYLSGDDMTENEYIVLRKDGSTFPVAVSSSPIIKGNKIIGFRGIAVDITERKNAEESLRQSEERFRSIAESTPIPLSITRQSDGTILYVNDLFGSVIGVPPNELIGRNITDFYIDPTSRPFFANLLDRGELIRGWELSGKKADGTTVYVIASIQPVIYEGEQAYMGSFYDISDRKQMEDQLQEHLDQETNLRQQLEAEIKKRVEFTRALAHELKTPLTSVLSSSGLLASELSTEPLSSLAKNISRGASNLNSRIDELLDMARGEVGMLQLKYESFDLVELLKESAEGMIPLALERGQSLTTALSPTPLFIRADPIRVQQIVTNLINNAIKFTPKGGKITVRSRKNNGAVSVEVQDTGRGIPKEERQRIFEPYERLKGDRNSLSGLGLGLYLSKTLVELHGGQIWVKSHMGRGSTFGFTLPVETSVKPVAEQEQVTKLWKVLIIEDDREIVDSISLSFHLRWPEAELVSTGLGEEGVEVVETEDPDIVILDLGLPDISGYEVLRQIRLFSSVPVIILTVKGEETDMVKGLEWGADDYVVKPFKQLELLARLKVQIRKRAPLDEEAPIICGALRLEPSTFQLTFGGREISLTIVEGRIIEHLMRNAGHVVTHARLAEAVWGEDYPGAIDSLRVYIRYLRQKLEKDPSRPKMILTKAGVGYSMAKPTKIQISDAL